MSGACQPSSVEKELDKSESVSVTAGESALPSAASLIDDDRVSQVSAVTTDTFESEVLRSDLPVVVDFYADWCPPCRLLAPVLRRLSEDFAGEIKFVKINSDEEPLLAEAFDVASLPTVVLIENGRPVDQFAGVPEEEALRKQLVEWIESRKLARQ